MIAHTTQPALRHRLPALASRWRTGALDAAVFAALYFFHWQIARHGLSFASRKNKTDVRPDANAWIRAMESVTGEGLRERLLEWLEHYQFRGVIGNVPVALAQWLRGAWPLVLREDVPTPLEMLHMQARGRRAVTLITEPARLCQPVLNKPDAYAFFLHDLEHAYKFFHSAALHDGQCEFFIALEALFDAGAFAGYAGDAEFMVRLHYLMSDMNTHPEHSRQYLRAILVEHHLRREHKALSGTLSSAAECAIRELMRALDCPMPQIACA